MRYFLTTVADRPVLAGGRTFNFDPVSLRGGSWVGVLALDEESGASILLAADHPSVSEITQAQYDSEKKKQPQSTARLAQPQPAPVPNHLGPRVADRAGQVIDPTIAEPPSEKPVADLEIITGSVELHTTSAQPPDDPMLADPVKRSFQ